MPKLQLIAVKMEGKTVESFKLADVSNPARTENGLVDKSQPFKTSWFDPTAVADMILTDKAQIIGVHNNGLFIDGSNGAFSRYANLKIVEQGKKYPLTVFERVNINGVDGCTVIDVDGRILTVSMSKLVKYAEAVGISNGKVVEHNGVKFISSIRGEYNRIGIVANYEKNVGPVEQEGEVQLMKKLKHGGEREQGYWPEGLKLRDEKLNLTIEEKLIVCFKAIQNWNFFMYSILANLTLIPLDPRKTYCPTMGVDIDMNMVYNPFFVRDLRLEELILILLHETYHILFSHPARIAEMQLVSKRGKTKTGLPFKEEALMYNIAADLFVNKYIANQFDCTIKKLVDFPHTVLTSDPFVTNTSVKKWSRGVKQVQFIGDLVFNDQVNCEKDSIETLFKDLLEQRRREMEEARKERERRQQQADENFDDMDGLPQDSGESGGQTEGGQSADNDHAEADNELDESTTDNQQEMNNTADDAENNKTKGESSDYDEQSINNEEESHQDSKGQSNNERQTSEAESDAADAENNTSLNENDTPDGQGMNFDNEDETTANGGEPGLNGSDTADDSNEASGSTSDNSSEGNTNSPNESDTDDDSEDNTSGSDSGSSQRDSSSDYDEGNDYCDDDYEEEMSYEDELEAAYEKMSERNMSQRREQIAEQLKEYMQNANKNGTDLSAGSNKETEDSLEAFGDMELTPEEYQERMEQLKNWKEKLKSTVLKAEVASQQRGLSLSESERRLVDSIIKPVPINWKVLLKRMFNMAATKANSFKRPSRRPEIDSKTILPGKTRKEPDGLEKIIFAIDTSGSVGDAELKYVLGTIRALSDKYKIDVEILWWSTYVNGVVPIKSSKDLITAYRNVASDGGTCAENMLKYIADKNGRYKGKQVHGLIIFTDGYIEDNLPVEYRRVAKNILWMIHSRRPNTFNAPFGTTSYIEVD